MVERKYVYKAFGLIIESDFSIPEFIESHGQPEVFIKYGEVKPFLENPDEKGIRFEAAKDEFLLRLDGIAKFYVVSGNKIIIEPDKDAEMDDIRVFLLGSVFAALLHQKQHLVLHGSSIVVNGKGILFAGISGSGKSTLAAALCKKGYKLLTDDLCAIKLNEVGIPEIIPGFPKLKLWEDSAKLLGENIDLLTPLRSKLKKYRLDAESMFSHDSVPMSKIYILHDQNNSELMVEHLQSTNKLKELITNTYRYRFMKAQGGKSHHFKQIAAVANAVDISIITRDKKLTTLEEILILCEKEINTVWER
ncbi:MAG: hypothetical protein P4L49_00305 [Desulfosporosinus sp.]|nr:hypothetical protein [Desulfosporosinus sp.]